MLKFSYENPNKSVVDRFDSISVEVFERIEQLPKEISLTILKEDHERIGSKYLMLQKLFPEREIVSLPIKRIGLETEGVITLEKLLTQQDLKEDSCKQVSPLSSLGLRLKRPQIVQ